MISIRIPLDLVEKLDNEAESLQRSRNFIIIETLNQRYKAPEVKKTRTKKEKANAR